MKVLLSHLTGNANVNAAAYGFEEAGLMGQFHVTLAAFPGTLLHSLSKMKAFSEIGRRKFNASLQPYVQAWPWLEIGRLIAQKAHFSALTRPKAPLNIETLCNKLDNRVASKIKIAAKGGISGVYGYEDVAKYSFIQAKQAGLQCLYDMPIGYWRTAHRLLNIERERWPEWASTLTGLKDTKEKLERKDEELMLADRIFAASSFTAKTLKEFPFPIAPVDVIPYGFPPVSERLKQYSSVKTSQPLKLLFVGSLSQRKGIANLFAAVEPLKNHVTLTVVGSKMPTSCLALDVALAKHKWIPSLAHDKILKLMRESDALIFPSLFEGFGLVITEAMSQGTPVITTERTAGPDIIQHDQNGWLVTAGSICEITYMLEKLLAQRNLIEEVGRQAMETAKKRPWPVYGQQLAAAVKKHLEATTTNQ